jgi:segregation and condensation protein B
MNPDLQALLARLEAILFIHGEPLTRKRIIAMLGLKDGDLETILPEFKARLASPERGIMLLEDAEKLQLVTKPEFHSILAEFVKEELTDELTPAALETLAIIAYFGPISRNRIEYQRGVNSMFILRSLMLRGLVERTPDPAHPNSFLYRPSFDLLKHLGVSSQQDLPDYGTFQSLLTKLESQP